MNRQKNQLIIALVLLLLIVAAYFGVKYLQKNEKAEEEEGTTYTVTEIKTEDVTEVSYQSQDYNYHFKKEGDNWINQEDTSLTIDSAQVEAIITSITNMLSKQKIENPERLEDFGLMTPQKTVLLKTPEGETKFYFGDKNTLSNEYYLKVNEGSNLYMAEERVVTMFEKPVSDFIKPETEEIE